jgi:hypothetical protein
VERGAHAQDCCAVRKMGIKTLFTDFWGDRIGREIIAESEFKAQQQNTFLKSMTRVKFIKYKHKSEIKYELNITRDEDTYIQNFTEIEFTEFSKCVNKIAIE